MRSQRLRNWFTYLVFGCAVLLFFPVLGQTAEKIRIKTHTLESVSPSYSIRQLSKGTRNIQFIHFPPKDPSNLEKKDLIWITGFKTYILDAQTHNPISDEYLFFLTLNSFEEMDATRLLEELRYSKRKPKLLRRPKMRIRSLRNFSLPTLSTSFHAQVIPRKVRFKYKGLITLLQGQSEINFPEGFAIPVLSQEKFFLRSQLLNCNPAPQKRFELKFKTVIEYVYDEDLNYEMKPLIRYDYNFIPTSKAASKNPAERNSNSWDVTPGQHIYQCVLRPRGFKRQDSPIHYINFYFGPFGQSVEIKDSITGQEILKAKAQNYDDRIGISHTDHYSSTLGILLSKDHLYEFNCVYNNTSSKTVAALNEMCVFYLDKKFNKKKFMNRFILQ